MKKMKIVVIIVILLSNILFLNTTFADDILEDIGDEYINLNVLDEELAEISTEASKLPSINSRAAIIYERNSKVVLYGKNENTHRPMASTTKIMTSIIVLENVNLSDVVEISKKSAGTGGSRLGLKTGDKITVHDLLYGLMLCSGNDAAVALAEYTAGSVDKFAQLMNSKAKELGLENSSFVTPHGLDADNHYTTAYELAVMADYALNIDEFANIVRTKNYTVYINGTPKNLTNTNELLGNLDGVYGVKTGFTNGANRCLVTSTKREYMDIICVVLGADTKKNRTQDSIKLIEYAFTNYQMVDLNKIVDEEFEKWRNTNSINIIKGEKSILEYNYDNTGISIYPILKEDIKNINIEISTDGEIKAPVSLNEEVGKVKIIINNNEVITAKITSNESVNKKGIYDYLKELVLEYSNYINKAIRFHSNY